MNNNKIKPYIISQDRQVPRYTSYPTAPHFQSESVEAKAQYDNHIKEIQEGDELSLYVHIPFCQKLCWYCGCNTNISMKYEPVESYTDRLVREIKQAANKIQQTTKVTHLHFGGGSPSLLKVEEFSLIMQTLKRCFTFDSNAEIAMEIDPRTLTEAKVATYAKEGMNRVSLGVQDFNAETLRAVNRQQPFHLTYQAVNWFRAYGIRKVNIDLMYGLPHQNIDTMTSTIDMTLSLQPDRIAMFAYAHVPWMKKHMNLIKEQDLPNSELRYDMFEHASNILEQSGMTPIGIDHFAKEDDELFTAYQQRRMRRNFQGYTTDIAENLLAFGASSISKFRNGYTQNYTDVTEYKKHESPVHKYCEVTEQDKQVSALIQDIMCYMKADIPKGMDYNRETLNELESNNIIALKDQHIAVNPKATQAVRLVCSAFDPYYQASPQQQPRYAKAI